jgi:3-hydroxyisobutyrate dehydrogenase-like beta-hydroxyacid dehydrogenase
MISSPSWEVTIIEMRKAGSVGFIGLGTMGEPMAANIVGAGIRLTVFDVRADPMDRLARLGAVPARSVCELAASCDVILTAVVDEVQVASVLIGTDDQPGALRAVLPGTVVVVHSTVGPAACRRLDAAARNVGARLLDAPITGGPGGAAAGTLSILVGGEPEDLAICQDVFDATSTEVIHLGPVGMAQLAKVANNCVLAITMQAVHEAIGLARNVGLDPEAMLHVLRSGAGESWVARNWAAIGASAADYPGGVDGVADLTYKDLALALSAAHDARVAMPVTALTAQQLRDPYVTAQAMHV